MIPTASKDVRIPHRKHRGAAEKDWSEAVTIDTEVSFFFIAGGERARKDGFFMFVQSQKRR